MQSSRALTTRRPCLALLLHIGLFSSAGCGGGVPLLHPVHALPPGQTAFAAGVSDRFVLGDERRALDAAQQRLPSAPPGDQRFTRGVLVALAEGPALAPFIAGRVGIPGSNEAGLSYTGQALRGDARHAFERDQSAFSAGLGLTARGFGQSALDLPGTDLSHANGFGVDLPLLYGFHTDADLLSIWAGLRGSFDHWSGSVALDPGQRFSLSASRVAGGPVLGFAVGLPPLWAAVELEMDYAHVTGSLERPGARYDAEQAGWSARPAGALIAKF